MKTPCGGAVLLSRRPGWLGQLCEKPLLAPLELTIGASERIGADGAVVRDLDEDKLRADLKTLRMPGAGCRP